MTGASAVTVTDSCSVCRPIVQVTLKRESDRDRDVANLGVREPRQFRRQVVAAGLARPRAGTSPSLSLTAVRVTPVSALRSDSVTPGRTPPWASLTVPLMTPPVCAARGRREQQRQQHNQKGSRPHERIPQRISSL